MTSPKQAEKGQPLLIEDRASDERPPVEALLELGMTAYHALRTMGVVVLIVDPLHRVKLLPRESVALQPGELLSDEDLDSVTEDQAIEALVTEGRPEDGIMQYLARRKVR
jgi:hypothetical protein